MTEVWQLGEQVTDQGLHLNNGHLPGSIVLLLVVVKKKIRRFVEEEKMIQFHEFYGKPTTRADKFFYQGYESPHFSEGHGNYISENISI